MVFRYIYEIGDADNSYENQLGLAETREREPRVSVKQDKLFIVTSIWLPSDDAYGRMSIDTKNIRGRLRSS